MRREYLSISVALLAEVAFSACARHGDGRIDLTLNVVVESSAHRDIAGTRVLLEDRLVNCFRGESRFREVCRTQSEGSCLTRIHYGYSYNEWIWPHLERCEAFRSRRFNLIATTAGGSKGSAELGALSQPEISGDRIVNARIYVR